MTHHCEILKYSNTRTCKSAAGEAEFKLILPLFDNSGNKIKKTVYSPYINKLNKRFGGTSSNRIGGCFVTKRNKIECEGNVIVTAIRDFDTPYQKDKSLKKLNFNQRKELIKEDWVFVNRLSRIARKEFGQESTLAVWDEIKDAQFQFGAKKDRIKNKRPPLNLSHSGKYFNFQFSKDA